MQKVLKLSVHQLVDFLLREGDIDNRVFNRSTMQEGSRIHQSFQSSQASNYAAEYYLKQTFVVEDIVIELEGRADGVIKKKNGDYVIDEIKTTVADLNEFRIQNYQWHLGQAKCYALMFLMENDLESIEVRLTYIRQGKEKDRLIDKTKYNKSELEQYVYDLLEEYLSFYRLIEKHIDERNASIKNLRFPFPNYRQGQKELAKYCFGVAKNGGKFYCEAPTGIGKTVSVLYPYITSLSDNQNGKIFYLTAKNTGKETAYNTIEILKDKGLDLKNIIITAKEKICPFKDRNCNPDECPLAKGYYSKINNVIKYCLTNYSTYDLNFINTISQDNQICPFEFELDLSLYCDAIICDYNYLFDPISYLKRYFDEDSSNTLVLVDEAHNLVERSKAMYSASLSLKTLNEARKSVRHIKHLRLKRALSLLKKIFEIEKGESGSNVILEKISDEALGNLIHFTDIYQETSKEENDIITKELTNLNIEIHRFIRIQEFYNENYILYAYFFSDNVEIRLVCLDASKYIKEISSTVKATTFFSGTLSPMSYYISMLGGDIDKDARLKLPSPFPLRNLKIIIAPKVSIKYKNRSSSYYEVYRYINSFVGAKKGNYFIYCPSYEYLETIAQLFSNSPYRIYTQTKEMLDSDKTAFLNNFQLEPKETTIGFVVIGGAFGEGVDLVSDRLIGAVIIGVGLPRINFESDCGAEYFAKLGYDGYSFAYTNPGLNKVFQAVGRVIRSEEDRGAVLLIDERYLYKNYREMFKEEWKYYDVATTSQDVSEILNKFYK